MRKFTIVVSIFMLAIGLISTSASASAGRRHKLCTFQGLDRGSWTDHEIRATIRCAVEHYRVPGGKTKALCIARHESGFEARSSNPMSSAYGVYQVLSGTWDGWHGHLKKRWWHRHWDLSHSRGNARANVMVSIRIAHGGGWSPWSTSGSC